MRLNYDERYDARSSIKSRDEELSDPRPRASTVAICVCVMVAIVLVFLTLIIAVGVVYASCRLSCSCGTFIDDITGCSQIVDLGGIRSDEITETPEYRPTMYDCILNKPDGCPNMVGPNILNFSQYDFRIDERAQSQWEKAHADEDWTLSMPGIAGKLPDYMEVLLFDWYPRLRALNKESKILLWAENPAEAFSAALTLTTVGFSNVDWWFYGGFVDLNQTISTSNSARDVSNQPTRDACWMGWREGDIPYCPKAIPLGNITSYAALQSWVGALSVNLADARSAADWNSGTLLGAWNIPNYARSNSSFERSKFITKKNETWVVFYREEERYQWTEAFNAARNMMKFGFSDVWFVHMGGYDDLTDIPGFETGIGLF